jgi:hypothetical protein
MDFSEGLVLSYYDIVKNFKGKFIGPDLAPSAVAEIRKLQ